MKYIIEKKYCAGNAGHSAVCKKESGGEFSEFVRGQNRRKNH